MRSIPHTASGRTSATSRPSTPPSCAGGGRRRSTGGRSRPSATRRKALDVFDLNGEPGWDAENDRDGFRHRRAVIGPRLGGGDLLGGTLYELPPGESTWPYHYELGCEEWLVVVSGRPTLRAHDGERELGPGEIAVFPPGERGGHKLTNRTSEPCRVLLLSSKTPVAIVQYPDSGKTGLWTQSEGYIGLLRDEPKLDYWDGES